MTSLVGQCWKKSLVKYNKNSNISSYPIISCYSHSSIYSSFFVSLALTTMPNIKIFQKTKCLFSYYTSGKVRTSEPITNESYLKCASKSGAEVSPMTACEVVTASRRNRPMSQERKAKRVSRTLVLSHCSV